MKLILCMIATMWTLNCFAQSNCEGDACSEVSVDWEQATATTFACHVWTNNSSRKVRLSIRSAVGFQCLNWSEVTLNPHKSYRLVGAFCNPFKANYAESLPTPLPPPQPPPIIKEGNYRLKNVASGLYLSGQFFDRLLNEHFPEANSQLIEYGELSCKTITAKDDNAKWNIKKVLIDKGIENYEVGTKRINDILLCSRNLDWIVKEETFDSDRSHCPIIEKTDTGYVIFRDPEEYKLVDKQYGKTDELGLESRKFVPFYTYRAWVFQKVNGTEYYKIRSASGFYYLFYDDTKSKVLCDEILGEPKSAMWILEECQ